MSKFLRLTMPSDGTIWEIPAAVIAQNRAGHYSKIDSDTTFEEEYDYTLSDDSELLDWAFNNMNWSDVSAQAVKVGDVPREPDYNSDWAACDTEIIEHPEVSVHLHGIEDMSDLTRQALGTAMQLVVAAANRGEI